MAAPRITTTTTTAHRWLPQFCSLPTLFALMVVAELVAVVLALAPAYATRATLAELGIASVFVQWLALLNAVVLCSMRETLERWSPRVGFVVAWLLAVVVTGLGSGVVYAMDQTLGFGLTDTRGSGWRFALGNAAICALIAAALLRYLYMRELWQERVQAAAKAQVDALQARIRPHFLFNSMNTIASLIRRARPMPSAVEDLSELFRAALGTRCSARSARNSICRPLSAHRACARRAPACRPRCRGAAARPAAAAVAAATAGRKRRLSWRAAPA